MANWMKVPISSVVQPVQRAEIPIPGRLYRQVGVRLWGQGAYEREPIDGSQTQYASLNRVEDGDIIINKIWARNGSVAVINEELAGCFGSNEFPTFLPNSRLILSAWFHWITKTSWFWTACDEKSQGTSGKNRIRPEKFLEIEIPLPPLDEQRRIVERIEAVARRVEEAQKLRQRSVKDLDNLLSLTLEKTIDRRSWDTEKIGSVLSQHPRNGLGPQTEVGEGGLKMLRISAVSSSATRHVDLSAYKTVDVAEEVARPFFIEDGDVFVVRYNGDLNRVAKAAIYHKEDNQRFVYPDKLIRLKPDPDMLLADYLVYALSTPRVRMQIESLCKTTAGQIGINGSNIQSLEICIPPLEEQRTIVQYLDSIQDKQVEFKSIQTETGEALGQLQQAVIEQFIGGKQ